LFNSVAGYRSITSNFPGVTVHYTRSRIQLNGQSAELIDLPGAYSLTASTPAESATRDFLLQEGIDTVINVIDASVLSRSLELTLQLVELGLPVVVCLNMMDEAHRKGIRIVGASLAGELGVPVVETLAGEGVGIHELFQTALQLARKPTVAACGLRYHCDTETVITDLAAWLEPNLTHQDCLPPRLLAIKLLEGDEHLLGMASAATQERTSAARKELAEARGRPAEEVIESERHALSMQLFESCARVTHAVKDLREQLDLLLTHRVWGYLFLGGMLAAFFGMVYGTGSLLEPPILRLFDRVTRAVTNWLGATGLASTIVTGLLQGLSGGVAIVLPYLLPFLIGMAILEDVGYLPRVAYLMDSLMHRIGLHGVAIVPAILGYGCNVPAVMATRILTSARDRFIAAVISTLVPCSARMTVIFGLVAFYLGPLWAMLIYALNIVVVACSGKLLSMIMPEGSPGLILEVPPYHLPKAQVVLSKTWLRLREFIVVAWPVLIAGSVLLSLAEHYHWDSVVNHALAPFTTLLGLPEVVGVTLIFGILRKELSMIMLIQALGTPNVLSVMTASQIVVFTLFITFYIPCVATLAALVRETGWRLTAAVATYSLLVATLIGMAGRALSNLV
jgi:ferrous iron transport protein B